MAEDRKTASSNNRGKTPVTWHPLFPAMLAVWFGALFGLGILAVRASLLETLVLSFGIDGLVPAAAPPLGATARILLALGFAMTGAVIGGAIGLLMARSRPDNVARRAEAAVAREAARATDEPADSPADSVAGGSESQGFFDVSQLKLDDEVSSLAEPEGQAEPADELEPEIEVLAADAPEPETALKPARAFERPLDPVSFPLPEAFPVPGGAAAARLTGASLDSLSHLELIERLALSLQKRREEAAAAEAQAPAEVDAADAEAEPAATLAPTPAPTPTKAVPSYYPAVSEAAAEQGYASLLGLSRPAVETDEEADEEADDRAIARFPESFPPAGTGRQTPEATERALRDALATLERMSGAA